MRNIEPQKVPLSLLSRACWCWLYTRMPSCSAFGCGCGCQSPWLWIDLNTGWEWRLQSMHSLYVPVKPPSEWYTLSASCHCFFIPTPNPQPPLYSGIFLFLTCTHTSCDHTLWSDCPVVHINTSLYVGVNYSLIDESSHRLPICPNYYFQCSEKCFHRSVKMRLPSHSDLYRMFRLMH